jgi:acyl transferase domain-containing protein/thioesterase domain-containing protein/acyl carrier protein
LDVVNESSANDIAIIGLALRVPGASDARQFWQNLRNGVESITDRTPDQLVAAGESLERIRRRNYVPRTAALPGMADFDAEFFGFSPKDAAIMDPQHRHFLECAWEAFEDAARPPESVAGPVGVFAGCGMGSYFYFNVCSQRPLVDQVGMFLLRHTGNDKDFLATRASYLFDLHGPSVNVQTACSTSLVAIHYAAQSLLNGECEMAIAGGVTIELPHDRGYLFQEGEILSPDGHCRAFDHRSAGTVFGSGVGVVVLRRLADAIADGDPIRAVIKATAINNDGAGKASYLAPSVTGQAEAIVEAQALAGVGPDTIHYVECHGTGTSIGDPIEIAALTQAFRLGTDKTGYCRVGSVKSNIGHTDTAAGVISVIKAVLAIENGEIPPTLGYEAPNPAIDFASSPFVVADKLVPWPKTEGPRRAGVNSLGVGGTNAHAIIEQAPARAEPATKADIGPQLIVLSARNRKALDEAGQRIAAHLEATPDLRLEDVAHSLLEGRRRFDQRRVMAVADRNDAIAALGKPELRRGFTHTPIEGLSGPVLLFPGGGAQYPGMGRSLYARDRTFAATVDEGLSYLPAEVGARIRELWLGTSLSAADAAKELLLPSLQLPAILIIEVALARLWQSWGLKPAALIGHSMGEYAAACIAGVMKLERAVRLVQLRGELFDEVTGGGMLSVQMSEARLRACLPETLDIAVINAPELCVVSGPDGELEAFHQSLVADGIDATRVPINVAAHSRMLAPILGRFEAFLRETPLAPPQIPIVSNLSGTWMTPAEATDPLYWVRHLRSTVRFADGLAALAADKTRLYIEAGPGRVLSSLAKAQGIDANAVINSLPHADEAVDDRLYFLTSIGRAWATGLPVSIERFSADLSPRRVALPTYPFQHQRYFFDRVASGAAERDAEIPTKLPDIAGWGWTPTWKPAYAESRIGADREPGSYLVFLDDAGVGDAMAAQLRAKGHAVKTVALGDAFAARPDGGYVLCPELGREGYDALLKHLADNGGIPARFVHLWLLTADEAFRPGSSFFNRNQERGFYSLFFLAQALGDAELAHGVQITVLTNGAQRVGDERLRYPEKATVLGPAQVLPRELPSVQVRVVDVPLAARPAPSLMERGRAAFGVRAAPVPASDGPSAQSVVAMVWDDLFADPGSEVVAYRDGRRWTRTYREVGLDAPSPTSDRFREGGVYLITGGLGDLAVACAQELAKTYRARIALMGRLGLPDRSAWPDYLATRGTTTRVGRAIASIQAIEAAGGEVLYVSADLTNPEAVRQAVQDVKARFGALHGVLHAAGIVNDDLIQLKSVTDIEDVLAPKVLGTMVLDDALAGEPLDLIVLFSSTSTDTTPAGQVDYVAANAYLNAFAESRAGNGGPHVAAIHWGVWRDVGLAARAIHDAESDAPPTTVDAASQPLFEDRVHEEGTGDWLELRADPARHWLLDEHRLRTGEAVWPGTGYIELVAEAAREFGIHGAIEIKDLVFLRPLHVADGTVKPVRVLVARDGQRLRIAIESRVETDAGPAWLRHAEAAAAIARDPRPPALDIPAAIAACTRAHRSDGGAAMRSAQDRHLRFGPRWQVLRELHLGEASAIAKLSLADDYAADVARGLLVHPALADIATGYAMELIRGYDAAAGLWVPASYGRIRLYQALPATVWSAAKLSDSSEFGPGFASFDITITDEGGRVVAVVESFTVKQLEAGADFSAALHDVSGAVAVASRGQGARELSPGMARLAAQVDQGIAPAEGGEALRRAVAVGLPQVVVSSMDLTLLKKAAAYVDEGPAASAGLDRPNVDSEFVAPATEIEKTLAGFWSELLGIEKIGTADSFFDLGGHSLVAVRLFRMIKKAYAVDFPISVLFEAPTIAQCAELIEQSGAGKQDQAASGAEHADRAPVKAQFTHVVQMHPGRHPHATPLFICAGMFGNILNLRHLAVQVGQDRPVYGLQARGLYGGQAPHETFEEMAASYLEEVRVVQPHGPYLLSGFSGGGLVAYEMAQQLLAAGETVDMVVLLDTPYPEDVPLSRLDRLTIRYQEFREQGRSFFFRWARDRIAFELARRQKANAPDPGAERFHNDEIEAAFLRALNRYRAAAYDGAVFLMRPKLRVAFRLSGGRPLNTDRRIVKSDNGWSPYLTSLLIKEVPGDHDSMVLEPNVRVLASYLREALRSAGQAPKPKALAAE